MLSLLLGLLSLLFWHKSVFQLDPFPSLFKLCNRLDCYCLQTERGCTFCWTLSSSRRYRSSCLCRRWSWFSGFSWPHCRLSLVLSRLLWTYFLSNQQQEWDCQYFSCKPLGWCPCLCRRDSQLAFPSWNGIWKSSYVGVFPFIIPDLGKLLAEIKENKE